jgi:hypothetical protein
MQRTKHELAHIGDKIRASVSRMAHHPGLFERLEEVPHIFTCEMHSESGIGRVNTVTGLDPTTNRVEGGQRRSEGSKGALQSASIFQHQIAWPGLP